MTCLQISATIIKETTIKIPFHNVLLLLMLTSESKPPLNKHYK